MSLTTMHLHRDINVVSCVDYMLHCIAKLMMYIYAENSTKGFMRSNFQPLCILGGFFATHVRTLQEDILLELQ
jgi:hypothetical protein